MMMVVVVVVVVTLILLASVKLAQLFEVPLRGELGDVRRVHGDRARGLLRHGEQSFRISIQSERREEFAETSGRPGRLE